MIPPSSISISSTWSSRAVGKSSVTQSGQEDRGSCSIVSDQPWLCPDRWDLSAAPKLRIVQGAWSARCCRSKFSDQQTLLCRAPRSNCAFDLSTSPVRSSWIQVSGITRRPLMDEDLRTFCWSPHLNFDLTGSRWTSHWF